MTIKKLRRRIGFWFLGWDQRTRTEKFWSRHAVAELQHDAWRLKGQHARARAHYRVMA